MATPAPDTVARFPLEWPLGWKRTSPAARQRAAFGTKKTVDGRVTVRQATLRLERELDRLGARTPTLSTNVSLRLDGSPRSDLEPTDPGAAVYFTYRGRATVLACDKWIRVADNIAALAAHIDALRRVDRYGVGTIEQALAGYKALPADTAADWRAVFGLPREGRVSVEDVDREFKRLARVTHPDAGGDEGEMAHLNRARDYALAEVHE